MDERKNLVNEEKQESASLNAAREGYQLAVKGLKETEHITELASTNGKDIEAGSMMQDVLDGASNISNWGAKAWTMERDIEF